MVSSERFSNLPDHMWPRLRALLDSVQPGDVPMHLSLGEPRHKFPDFVTETILEHAIGFNKYPPNNGTPELLNEIASWVQRRFGVSLDPETEVMTLNGTREGLFNAALATAPESKKGKRPAVLIPNPFYPVYMIGALASAAEPILLPATKETGHTFRRWTMIPHQITTTGPIMATTSTTPATRSSPR